MHHHLTHMVQRGGRCQRLEQFVAHQKWMWHAPYAFHPAAGVFAIGKRTAYACPHPACQAHVQTMNFKSPHCGVVHDLMRLFPELAFHEFCAGYVVIQDATMVTNEQSGHFGHNWNDEHRQTIREFFHQHTTIRHFHM